MKVDVTLLKRINDHISRRSTGCPDCFAAKLGISVRLWYKILDYLKSELNAPIQYSSARETYYYLEEWDLYIGDLNRIKADLIKGVLETINKTVKISLLAMFVF